MNFYFVIKRIVLPGKFPSMLIAFRKVLNTVILSSGNKKRMCESKMEEIRLSSLTVIDAPKEKSPVSLLLPRPSSEDADVVCFHLKLINGIEINKENASPESLTCLLQSLSALC